MKDFAQRRASRTVVGVHRHDVAHVGPPAPTHVSLCDGIPACLVFDLDIAEQAAVGLVEKNRIAVRAVVSEHVLQFPPDRRMAALVLRELIGVLGHAKCLADQRALHGGHGCSRSRSRRASAVGISCAVPWRMPGGNTRVFEMSVQCSRSVDASAPYLCSRYRSKYTIQRSPTRSAVGPSAQ